MNDTTELDHVKKTDWRMIRLTYALGLILLSFIVWGIEPLTEGKRSPSRDFMRWVSCDHGETYKVGLDPKGFRTAYYCVNEDGLSRNVSSTHVNTRIYLLMGSMTGGMLLIVMATVMLVLHWRQQALTED